MASKQKKGYKLPRSCMTNSDITRLINSDEVQTIVRPIKTVRKGAPLKKNPLRNLGALLKLNPYAKTARRAELLQQVGRCFCCTCCISQEGGPRLSAQDCQAAAPGAVARA